MRMVRIFAGRLWPLAISCAHVLAQATPTASRLPVTTGFQLPHVDGSLQYAVTGSESVNIGNNGEGGTGSATTLSGDVAFLSPSKIRPFSLVYAGGYSGGTGGYPSTFFQTLSLSQVLTTRYWNFVLADSVSYLPFTATTGLSGVPGVGDLGLDPIQVGPDTGQGLLSSYATRVSNFTSGTVQRRLSASTSLDGTGSFALQRFVGGSDSTGLDTNQESGVGGITHRLDAHNTLSTNYTLSRFTYPGTAFSFTSQGVNLEYIRQWNRKLSTDVSAGPQISTSSGLAVATGTSVDYAINAGVAYTNKASSLSARFTRTTNNGSGVVAGARTQTANGGYSRRLGVWNGTVYGGYTRTTSIFQVAPLNFSANSLVASAQAGRAFGRRLSAYASYTAQWQSSQGTATTFSLFQGLSNIFGFGLTYSPAPFHLAQH